MNKIELLEEGTDKLITEVELTDEQMGDLETIAKRNNHTVEEEVLNCMILAAIDVEEDPDKVDFLKGKLVP